MRERRQRDITSWVRNLAEGFESIEFSARYKDWVVIKKMSIRDDTKSEEVALIISSIRQTLDKKAFEVLGIDTTILSDYAGTLTSGVRKSFSNLSEVLKKLDSKETKDTVNRACNGKKELFDMANAYLLRSVTQGLGFDFDINQNMLVKSFPKLKVPMPPGRKAKK